MLKSVLKYHEHRTYSDGNDILPSITTLPQKRMDNDTREKVLDYMLSWDFVGWYKVGGPFDTDAFTGKSMQSCWNYLNDEIWEWSDNLAMYVRDYNIKLPEDFVNHVLDYYKNGGKVGKLFIDWRPADKTSN